MKIIVISPKNRTVYNFRGDLIKQMIESGCEVLVTGPNEIDRDKIEALGARLVVIPMNKNGVNPIADMSYQKKLYELFCREKPDVTFGYTVKPVIYGALAAQKAGIGHIVSMVTGAGYTFTSNTLKARMIRAIVSVLYKRSFAAANTVIFQNPDDLDEFVKLKLLPPEKGCLVNGSGVNMDQFPLSSFPLKTTFFMLSRIMKSKGVKEYLEAARIVKQRFPEVRFMLLGGLEKLQDSTEEDFLTPYIKEGVIEYFGETEKVADFYAECSVYVLPSYREGTPRTVLEAMSMGRPIITTDAPGCRETVVDGKTGFLVPIKAVDALAEKMLWFCENPSQILVMGAAAHTLCQQRFEVRSVNEVMLKYLKINRKKEENRMSLYEKILNGEEKISLVGLGYVGMPIAVAFAKKIKVIGFDLNQKKIELYKSGIDPTKEVGNEVIKNTTVEFTSDETKLCEAKFHIVAVPTPVNSDHTPDLTPVEGASKLLGRNLTKGSVVVYESTVFPGVTEDICVPILEKESGLKCGIDFKVGYSPERINPGDKVHRLETIIKIVSGMDEETLDTVAKVYELVVDAGVHRAESIKVAEAAKVIENSQRDINIAFMNELSIIFNKMGIDTKSVLEAAGTKWNFLNFTPGLVGGHCIGVDPYYLTYKAEQLGYHSQIILSGRRINDDMGKYVAENLVKKLIAADISVKNAKVAVLGFTFKENCPDTRNTKIIDIVNELREYGISPVIADPVADFEEAKHEYNVDFTSISEIQEMDAVILAVAHNEFKSISLPELENLFKKAENKKKVLIDLKGLLNRKEIENNNEYLYWRL